jgi:type IV pilus assembly protein PilX
MICLKSNASKVKCKQKGVVLFFALIALVAMSLAAVALIRSVDTNSIIAGNLSFKQSTMFSSDRGVDKALAWVAANPGALNADSPANGYYAVLTDVDGNGTIDNNGDAKSLVDANGFVDGTDAQNNAISYVVQRMCRVAGPPTSANCLFGPVSDDGGEKCGNCPVFPTTPGPTVIYRVTARVEGAKNTLSYIQGFVY